MQMPLSPRIFSCIAHGSAVEASGNCCFDPGVRVLHYQADLWKKTNIEATLRLVSVDAVSKIV